ncbi:hypothetical protein TRFO_24484 [Tritrichomonas foetus]|uniref:Uncharacterized protein n=1 Tax=Tritrichomonas foetus TaxID=1144522 RepID=A0A1J4K7H2_9EUKA|nr:hypothetical protein TRFO_24484 [Tritrichomonas foetus]|eukprot:OHT07327.1 hypothetical protein TRFO_24484 [Tritrichomonas foetus]
MVGRCNMLSLAVRNINRGWMRCWQPIDSIKNKTPFVPSGYVPLPQVREAPLEENLGVYPEENPGENPEKNPEYPWDANEAPELTLSEPNKQALSTAMGIVEYEQEEKEKFLDQLIEYIVYHIRYIYTPKDSEEKIHVIGKLFINIEEVPAKNNVLLKDEYPAYQSFFLDQTTTTDPTLKIKTSMLNLNTYSIHLNREIIDRNGKSIL